MNTNIYIITIIMNNLVPILRINEVFMMKKMLFFSVALFALVFLVVSCAPKEPQTPEEKLTDEMHAQGGNALAGQAIRIRCATAAVTNCRVADGRILFTYRGYNYNYPTWWCSGTAAYNAYARNSRCISPTLYEDCLDQCTGLELCSNGVCAVRGGDCRAGGEPSRCLDQGSCLSAGFKWLNFDMDPDDAPRGCYASCPSGTVDSNGDHICSLADGEFGCSDNRFGPANDMCESNNCDLARNTCVAVPPPEICDNLDNDRNGVIDNGCDDDNDNFCDSGMSKAVGVSVSTCRYTGAPSDRGDDCNDNNVAVNPYAPDVTCDGIDQNCDGSDGYQGSDYCDGVDNNCDGGVDQIGGLATCPSCTDSDGGNYALVGGFTSEIWPAFPAQNRVVYDSCFSTTRLNETVCVPNYGGRPGLLGSSVIVDCSASGRRCISGGLGSGARCG